MARSIPWARVLAEGVVIVVSILLGLGIDAWWDGRQATRDARNDLERVSAELVAARAEIASTNDLHERFYRGTVELRRIIEAAANGETVSVPDTFLTGILMQAAAEPPRAAVESTLSSGSLEALDNDPLQTGLLLWLAMLDDLRDDELRARGFQETESGPYLRDQFDLAIAGDAGSAWAQGRLPAEPELAAHVTQLQPTLRLRNIIAWQINYSYLLIATSRGVLEHIDSLQALISEELS